MGKNEIYSPNKNKRTLICKHIQRCKLVSKILQNLKEKVSNENGKIGYIM